MLYGFVSGNRDPQEGTIVHIDHALPKSDLSNLVFLCLEHSRQLDQEGSVRLGELKRARAGLYKTMEADALAPEQPLENLRAYEKLVVDLIRSTMSEKFGDDFQLIQNAFVRGQSGVSHQIDIKISFNIAGLNYLTVFNVKYRRAKLGSEDVLQFASVADDIGANKGVIVANSGFSSAALQIARSKGLSLFNISEVARNLVESTAVDQPAS